jgi:hypothetical protein
LKVSCSGAAWMAGTSPAMTTIGCTIMTLPAFRAGFSFPGQPCPKRAKVACGACLRTNATRSPWEGAAQPSDAIEAANFHSPGTQVETVSPAAP